MPEEFGFGNAAAVAADNGEAEEARPEVFGGFGTLNLKVGVFNVLAQSVSYCSKLYSEDFLKIPTNRTALFKVIKKILMVPDSLPAGQNLKQFLKETTANLHKGNTRSSIINTNIKTLLELDGNEKNALEFFLSYYNKKYEDARCVDCKQEDSTKKWTCDTCSEYKSSRFNFKKIKDKETKFNKEIKKKKLESLYDDNLLLHGLGIGMKKFLQSYANKAGLGLFGGFEVGNMSEEDIYDPEKQKLFYENKRKFIEEKIEKFFNEGNEGGDILVCPEFDYYLDSEVSNAKETGITLNKYNEGFHINLPTNVKGVRGGNMDMKHCQGSSSPKMENAKANFCRVVLYNENKCANIALDDNFKELSNKLKTAIGKHKENNDVLEITLKDGGNACLVSVHLDSTTSTDDYKGKKEAECIALTTLCTEIRKEHIKEKREIDIFVAGDFNFPLDPTVHNDEPPSFDTDTLKNFNQDFGFKYTTGTGETYTEWKTLMGEGGLNILKFKDNKVGRVVKKRFTDKLGNDQLWEGKGEERAYNTDFVGLWQNNDCYIKLSNLETINQGFFCPYINTEQESDINTEQEPDINTEQESVSYWYSDHGFVVGEIVKQPKEVVAGAPAREAGEAGKVKIPGEVNMSGGSRKHRRSKHKSRPKKNRTQKRNKNKSSKRNIPKRKKNSKNLRRRRVNGKKSQRRK